MPFNIKKRWGFYVGLASLFLSVISVADTNPRRILEKTFKNWAWGYQEDGCYLNDSKDIYYYSVAPRKILDIKIGKLDAETFEKVLTWITEAQKGKVSEPRNVMADAGIRLYKAFIHNKERVKEVILQQWGDWQIDNDSPAAQELVKLLDKECKSPRLIR